MIRIKWGLRACGEISHIDSRTHDTPACLKRLALRPALPFYPSAMASRAVLSSHPGLAAVIFIAHERTELHFVGNGRRNRPIANMRGKDQAALHGDIFACPRRWDRAGALIDRSSAWGEVRRGRCEEGERRKRSAWARSSPSRYSSSTMSTRQLVMKSSLPPASRSTPCLQRQTMAEARVPALLAPLSCTSLSRHPQVIVFDGFFCLVDLIK